MQKFTSFFLSLSTVLWISCTSLEKRSENQKHPDVTVAEKTESILTQKDDGYIVVDEKFFSITYDRKNRIARSVEYRLKADDLRKSFVKRKNRFHSDVHLPNFGIVPVSPDDYKYSGYDRGHLAPSGDFEWSEEANDATFTMANMAPQTPSLNRSAWRGLEEQVREWACTEQELRVITGPILEDGMSSLKTGVAIPKKFFKVILDETPPRKAIGFVMTQNDSSFHAYKEDVLTIKEIERVTNIHFFEGLAKDEEVQIKNHSDLKDWTGTKCKAVAEAIPQIDANNIQMASTVGLCRAGSLKPAEIQGCCSGHEGVMGPKKHRACCGSDNRVICNDGTLSATCICDAQ